MLQPGVLFQDYEIFFVASVVGALGYLSQGHSEAAWGLACGFTAGIVSSYLMSRDDAAAVSFVEDEAAPAKAA